jgi:hypothetical protein
MSNVIVPNSAQSGKSAPAPEEPPLLKPKNETLQDWIEDTEYAIQALQTWLTSLKSWQSQDKVPTEDFERAYAVICEATLSSWARVGIVELRIAVTGEQFEG